MPVQGEGGNLLLSQRRAQTVLQWLVTHKIAAARLQAFGYGDTDPAAPNTSGGQPLNRRVVVVIDPAVAGETAEGKAGAAGRPLPRSA